MKNKKAEIFYKVTSDAQKNAEFIVNAFESNDPTIKQTSIKLLQSFNTLELQNFLLCIEKNCKEKNDKLLKKVNKRVRLALMKLLSTKSTMLIKELLKNVKKDVVELTDYPRFRELHTRACLENLPLQARAYLENLIESADINPKSRAELASIISRSQNIINLDNLAKKIGTDMVVKLIKKALHVFVDEKEQKYKQEEFYDRDPTLLIRNVINNENYIQKSDSPTKLSPKKKNLLDQEKNFLLNPDSFIYNLSEKNLKAVLVDIDKEVALAIAKKIENRCKMKFFSNLGDNLRSDSDLVLALVNGLTENNKANSSLMAKIIGEKFNESDENEKIEIFKILNGLDTEKLKLLFAFCDDARMIADFLWFKSEPEVASEIFPILNDTVHDSVLNELRQKNNAVAKKREEIIHKIETKNRLAQVSAAILASAFFEWKTWSDIRRMRVLAPFVVGMGLPIITELTLGKFDENDNIIAYQQGPMLGSIAKTLFTKKESSHNKISNMISGYVTSFICFKFVKYFFDIFKTSENTTKKKSVTNPKDWGEKHPQLPLKHRKVGHINFLSKRKLMAKDPNPNNLLRN